MYNRHLLYCLLLIMFLLNASTICFHNSMFFCSFVYLCGLYFSYFCVHIYLFTEWVQEHLLSMFAFSFQRDYIVTGINDYIEFKVDYQRLYNPNTVKSRCCQKQQNQLLPSLLSRWPHKKSLFKISTLPNVTWNIAESRLSVK